MEVNATLSREEKVSLSEAEEVESSRSPALLACPCGRPIDDLFVSDAGQCGKYMNVSGNCCGEWMIEFRANYATGDELMALAREAWNSAPRAS